jgi:hypothetical protein
MPRKVAEAPEAPARPEAVSSAALRLKPKAAARPQRRWEPADVRVVERAGRLEALENRMGV